MKFLAAKIKKIPKYFWILLIISLVGFFLRVYKFSDWLRFSMDQSRDAGIISGVVTGKSAWPLLGPVAGGTFFHLGPAYYYFSIVSAKLFGDSPDKMAYPVLFFSVLTIPLFFFFLKEYFSRRISLVVTTVMSFSYFSVASARFSSNPNLAPFFVLAFLYGFLKMVNEKERTSFWWPVIVGLALGIGVQIHTTLLVILPIFTLLILAYLIKKIGWRGVRYALVIIGVSLAMNVPQIMSEIETRGQNTLQFFDGLGTQGSASESGLTENAFNALLCQAKANSYFISSFPVTDKCSEGINFDFAKASKELFGGVKDRSVRKNIYLADVLFILIFSILGYGLLVFSLAKEENKKKKNFLLLVALFNGVAYVFIVPVIASMAVSYFIILLFVPFVLLGLAFEYIEEKIGRQGNWIVYALAAILVFFSLGTEKSAAQLYVARLDNNAQNSDLEEVNALADYIFTHADPTGAVYLGGKRVYLQRFIGPLTYAVGRRGRQLLPLDINDANKIVGEKFFYLQGGDEKGDLALNRKINGYTVVGDQVIGPMEIYTLSD